MRGIFKLFSAFASTVLLFPIAAQAQSYQKSGDRTVIVSPVMSVERSTTVVLSEIKEDWWPELRNTWVAPKPGTDVSREVEEELQRMAEEITYAPEANKTAGPEDTISQISTYFANAYDGGIPNDNGLAVGKGQKVVSVANSTIKTFQGSSAAPIYTASLAGFSGGQGGSATKYDPKVTYDHYNDRFIVVFLNGFLASNSLIVVAFSQTDDPSGAWNIYTLDGSPNGLNVWTDFPQIGISTTELFVTGNLFTDGGTSQGSIIWQVNLAEGYAGQPLVTRNFVGSTFSLNPVEGGLRPYGPNMYFVRNVSNPIPTSKSVFISEITNTIAAGGVLNAPVALQSDLIYAKSPQATQKGTTLKLNTNDCRVQSSYIENGRIEAAWNTAASGKSAIYHLTITLSDAGLAFSQAKGQYIKIDSLSFGYPGIAPGGCVGADGENSNVVLLNYCSPNQYPGNAAVFIDTAGNIGPLKVLKTGFTWMGDDGTPSPWRWGDYADASARTNNPGEVWVGGSVGMMGGGQHRNGTYISKVFTQCCAGPIGIDPGVTFDNPTVSAFPSPANELIYFNFEVIRTDQYRVTIFDMNGKPVHELVNDRLKQGKAQLRFSTAHLTDGIYMVKVESDNGLAVVKRFMVAH
jgi:Secretion system C-terminal sorting domain